MVMRIQLSTADWDWLCGKPALLAGQQIIPSFKALLLHPPYSSRMLDFRSLGLFRQKLFQISLVSNMCILSSVSGAMSKTSQGRLL
jgi:hypothetical protein